MRRSVWFFFAALMWALSWSGSAAAGDTAATFSQAIELFTADQYAEALPLFRQAYEASGSPNARIYVARCLRELGRLPEAYQEMKGTVEGATAKADAEEKYIPTRDSAAAELALLERRVGQLVVAVAASPADLVVAINGAELSSSELGLPVAVHPGRVAVSVRASGKKPIQRTIEVPAGQTRSLALGLEDAADHAPPAPEPAPPVTTDEVESSGGELRIAGVVVAGLGLAGIGVFAVTATMAQSDYDDLDGECGGTTCPPGDQGRVDDGRTLTAVANVSLIAGSALLLGGVAMILFGGPSEPEDASQSAITVSPCLGPEAGGLTITGRF